VRSSKEVCTHPDDEVKVEATCVDLRTPEEFRGVLVTLIREPLGLSELLLITDTSSEEKAEFVASAA
jgi:hypothetical protein